MPAPPELGDIPGEIRKGKIPQQVDPQQPRSSQSDIGIPREITINLKGKK